MLTSYGARVTPEGASFTVWAPDAQQVEVVIYTTEDCCEQHSTVHTLSKSNDGVFRTQVSEARQGSRYKYRVDGKGPFPDPVSRFQPKGVHGPSQVMDFSSFPWTDRNWRGVDCIDKLVVYEVRSGCSFFPPSLLRCCNAAACGDILRGGNLQRRARKAPLPQGPCLCSPLKRLISLTSSRE